MKSSSLSNDTAVLLLAFGGPGSPDEVEPFLENIFCGQPVPETVSLQARERYKAIGGCSPLLEITRRQARSLQRLLQKRGRTTEVFVGMRYWHPSIPEVMTDIEKRGYKTVLSCVLAPFSSPAVVNGYERSIEEYRTHACSALTVVPVTDWHRNLLYLAGLSETVSEGLAWFEPHERHAVPILFTAHSLPVDQLQHDPYEHEFQTTVAAVARTLALPAVRIAYQSRGRGSRPWLGPPLESAIDDLAAEGARNVLIVPAGFVADHLEVLYDIDIALNRSLQLRGIKFHRAPVLNDRELFMQALAEAVDEVWPKQ